MKTPTDRQKIEFLRTMCACIGHTDGTPFDEATYSFYDVRARSCNIIGMKEIREMVEFYLKLPLMMDMGHVLTPPEKFVYWMLKDAGLIDAFSAMYDWVADVEAGRAGPKREEAEIN